MEWATQWHGPEGKVHADKRTVEYTGRGNHSADAVSFVGVLSVGQAHAARTLRDELDRVTRAPCLTSPLDSATAKSGAGKTEADPSLTTVTKSEDAESSRSDSKKKHKHRSNGKASASRKKRRVETKHTLDDDDEEDEEEDDDRLRDVLRLPVYYFELQVLATRHFQEAPGSRPHASDRERHHGIGYDDMDEEENGDDESEMSVEDPDGNDGESEEVAMDVDVMERAAGEDDELQALWRGRARRLIHDHLRSTSQDVVALTQEGEVSATLAAAGRTNGNGAEGVSGSNGETSTHRRSSPQQQHTNNGNGSISTGRLVRSSSSQLSPPSPPPLTHQQLLLSFPLSSSTIHQIRLRLERQHQQAQSHRRRFSSSGSGSADAGSVSLTSAISSIHARQRRETVRRKRSNHRIAVGFMFSKHGGDYKRDICHEELGRQACGIAFNGKTGEIVSNGQTYLQTDVRFGHGDTIGCGVILDTRTFFWTVNGRLVATLPVRDVHHLDDYEDHSVCDAKATEWFTAWADQLLPSVSLHDHGESVRALFTETPTERYRFDLDAFKQQHLKQRQTTLMAYAGATTSAKPFPTNRDEEDIMHKLIEDYFMHFGYGNALSALRDLHQGTHAQTSSNGSDSVELRHSIRQYIYGFKTREALRRIESNAKQVSTHDPMIILHCHILCVVDILYEGQVAKRKGSATDAISTAQDVLHEYLSGAADDDEQLAEIRAFMGVLLYPTIEEIPEDCPGRRYLIWQFREEVADALNDALSDLTPSEPCALEKLVDDLSELQRECLTYGASPFPLDETSLFASGFSRGHIRDHDRTKRRHSMRRSADDSDDEHDEESHSSSSGESDNEEEDEDDE